MGCYSFIKTGRDENSLFSVKMKRKYSFSLISQQYCTRGKITGPSIILKYGNKLSKLKCSRYIVRSNLQSASHVVNFAVKPDFTQAIHVPV